MKFTFRLLPLLKKDRLEGEVLGAEVRRAGQALEENEQRHRAALGRISDTEAALRDSCQQEQSIHLGEREILYTYLRYSHGVAEDCRKDATKARSVYEDVLGKLETKRKAIRTLEKQRDRKRREHDAEERRLDSKHADEAWLQRRSD